MKKATILTSSCNKAAYLNAWAESILKQRYRPLEVVVIDDDSRDQSRSMLRVLKRKFHAMNIKYKCIFSTSRQGCGGSYLLGLKNVTGDYVGILDADDCLMPDAVDFLMQQYHMNPTIGFIYTQFMICDKEMKTKKVGFCRAPDEGKTLVDMADLGYHCYSHWRTFSMSVPQVYSILNPELRRVVDKYMGYKLEELAPGMFINKICYKYREGVATAITSNSKRTKSTWREIIAQFKERREKENIKCFPISSVS